MHLYISGGALWLAKCPWSIAGRCHQWATVKLRKPNPVQEVLSGDPPGYSDGSDPGFAGAALPAGVTVTPDVGAPAADKGWVVRWSDREIGKIRGSSPVFAPAEATATPPTRAP